MTNYTTPAAPDAALLPAVAFTLADMADLATASRHLRDHHAVRVAQSSDYPSLPDAAEIYWPVCGGRGDDVRWLVWRNPAGVWLDELESQMLHGPLEMVGGAMALAGDILAGERARQVATIPVMDRLPLAELDSLLSAGTAG